MISPICFLHFFAESPVQEWLHRGGRVSKLRGQPLELRHVRGPGGSRRRVESNGRGAFLGAFKMEALCHGIEKLVAEFLDKSGVGFLISIDYAPFMDKGHRFMAF